MNDLATISSAALAHVSGGQATSTGFSLDGEKYCNTNFPTAPANQACKTAFGVGAAQTASKLGYTPLFGPDGKGAVVPNR